MAEIGSRAAAASRELAGVAATASSRDGAVTVTVDAAGALRRVRVRPGRRAAGQGGAGRGGAGGRPAGARPGGPGCGRGGDTAAGTAVGGAAPAARSGVRRRDLQRGCQAGWARDERRLRGRPGRGRRARPPGGRAGRPGPGRGERRAAARSRGLRARRAGLRGGRRDGGGHRLRRRRAGRASGPPNTPRSCGRRPPTTGAPSTASLPGWAVPGGRPRWRWSPARRSSRGSTRGPNRRRSTPRAPAWCRAGPTWARR